MHDQNNYSYHGYYIWLQAIGQAVMGNQMDGTTTGVVTYININITVHTYRNKNNIISPTYQHKFKFDYNTNLTENSDLGGSY